MPRGDMKGRLRQKPKPKRERRWEAGTFPVHDPEGVKRVLGPALAKRFALEWKEGSGELEGWYTGSKKAALDSAAEWLDTSYSVLHRLAHAKRKEGTPTTISWRLALQFEKRLDAEEWEKLRDRLFSEEVQHRQREYLNFIDREIERIKHDRDRGDWWPFSDEAKWLNEEFATKAMNSGVPANRLYLAKLRVFAPLVGLPGLYALIGNTPKERSIVSGRYQGEWLLIREEMRLLHESA